MIDELTACDIPREVKGAVGFSRTQHGGIRWIRTIEMRQAVSQLMQIDPKADDRLRHRLSILKSRVVTLQVYIVGHLVGVPNKIEIFL